VLGLSRVRVLRQEGCGVELDAIESFLVADEIDVIVVGRVSDLQAFDDQPWYQLAQLVEWFGQRLAGPAGGCPCPAAVRGIKCAEGYRSVLDARSEHCGRPEPANGACC